MKKFSRSVIIAAILLLPNLSLAQTQSQAQAQVQAQSQTQAQRRTLINQQDWITRRQQNQIEETNRQKEQTTIRKERDRKKKQLKEGKEKELISGKPDKCFLIKSIELIDANSISKRVQKKLTRDFIGKCISAKTLTEIITKIQTYYHKEGLITTRIFTPKQNIQSGNLKLQVLEGKIDEITFKNENFGTKMQKFTAFPFLEGKVLDLNRINQGIYQINRLSSNNAAMKIVPSDKEGEAVIRVQNQKKFPARATIGYDNLGNEFTGIRRTNFSGSLDNLLFLNDAINLNYSTNLDDDSQQKDIKSFTSSISIPFGYNTLSYDFSRTEFRGTNQGINGAVRLTGFSQRNNVSIDRVLLNEGNLRLSSQVALTTKSSASYLNQQKIETSERKLTIGSFGLTISNYFKNGVNLYLKPTYFKGLKILDAKQDDKNLSPQTPKAQFDYFKLYGQVSKRFLVPEFISKNQIPFTFQTEFDSQYSKQTLFGTEQFGVGGYHSVRGFRENYIAGDSGYYFRNKVSLNVGSLILPLISEQYQNGNNQNFITKNLVHLNKFSTETFFDYGYVKNKYTQNGGDGRLSGIGVRAIFASKYFDASLTYSAAKSHSRLITTSEKENKMVYFEISAKCC